MDGSAVSDTRGLETSFFILAAGGGTASLAGRGQELSWASVGLCQTSCKTCPALEPAQNESLLCGTKEFILQAWQGSPGWLGWELCCHSEFPEDARDVQ